VASAYATASPAASAAPLSAADDAGPQAAHAGDRRTCLFFLQGSCRYGAHCRFAHYFGPQCPNCGAEVDPRPELQERHLLECEETKLRSEERRRSAALACGICLENIAASGRRFGLLACEHAFCLSCIRQWRSNMEMRRESVRGCPLCRQESFVVVPCDRMVFDPERKARVLLQYKEKLARIPCMHFNRARGTCPFGSSCFYAHVDEEGRVVPPAKLRHRENADGEVEIMQQVRLCDFLVGE
jgi:E3 ubiquitin-protein ligase makorin